MKTVLLTIILLFALITCSTKHVYNRQDVFIRDGLLHENVTEILITGLVIDKYLGGQKKSEEPYVNGIRHGLYTVWFVSGQKASEQSYVNGKEEGSATAWYENGQKRITGNFKNGIKEGLWTSWYANGNKLSEITFANGEQTTMTQWDEHGEKIVNQTAE